MIKEIQEKVIKDLIFNEHNYDNTDILSLIDKIDSHLKNNEENQINILKLFKFQNKKEYLKPNYFNVYIFSLLNRSIYNDIKHGILEIYPKTNFISSLIFRNNHEYKNLEELLALNKLIEADKLTQEILCKLAGKNSENRQWLYFTEIKEIENKDLKNINLLWNLYSYGKFGFLIQRNIWLNTNKNWKKFWDQIGWINDNKWARYPNEFIWNIKTAPAGHLPLFNQIRGTKVIESIFNHEAWLN